MTDYSMLASQLLDELCDDSRLRYRRDLEDFSHGEMSILTYLCYTENGVCPGDLCETLGMTTPRISAIIAGLQKKGLVSRVTDAGDRRKIHIYISEEGRVLVDGKKDALRADISHILSLLGEDDAKEYVRIIGKINRIMNDMV
ncbi:MAG: winged helix-turn-helix transcriptional regulator [Clostridia bacterium]|nr:winged helix-turn-helix transcriptional regulator [Clostridia bacterium]